MDGNFCHDIFTVSIIDLLFTGSITSQKTISRNYLFELVTK